MVRLLLAALAAAVLAGQAAAQTALNDAAKELLGTWEFSNSERDKACPVTFKGEAAPGGFKLEFDKACAALFPFAADIVAWKYADNDLLRLIDAGGRTLVEFSEVESGIFEAPTPGVGVLFLQSPAAAGPPPRPAEQLVGDWALMRGAGKILCQLTLSNATTRDGLVLQIKPNCDPAILRLNLTAWEMDRGELVLMPARGNVWRFEEVDQTSWRRIPESADPITLVRQGSALPPAHAAPPKPVTPEAAGGG